MLELRRFKVIREEFEYVLFIIESFTMLSTIFLSFEDREMRLTFEKEKRQYYGRILLVVWPILILLTALLIVLDIMEEYKGET